MKQVKKINKRKIRRKERVRAKITGTAKRPRLSVFRSNRHIFAQLIDDNTGRTLASVSTRALTQPNKIPKSAVSATVGQRLAEAAKKLGIHEALFDKGH
ncbi:MAG: 50S ribosomal protein L18, partial [bacterium]|nr:50S ribosomal protein L18 [bacterium]